MRLAARPLSLGVLLGIVLAGACSRPRPAPEPSPAPAPQAPSVTVREPDAFYDPPANPPRRPGALLRSEPLRDVTLPAGMRGWRILYTTTADDHTPAIAAATVFGPADPPPGPRPVVTWAHATTGLLQRCMPSLWSAPTEGIPARDAIVAAGWVVVATDYSFAEQGGPHPYMIGEGEARAVLDAMRAARQMPELTLVSRTVVWGHSQGGHAALWTGIVGPRYAPDVEIDGVAAIAPAANPRAILATNEPANKRLGPYVARSYSRFYPDIAFDQALRSDALAAAPDIAGLCSFLPPDDPQRIAVLTGTFDGPALAIDTNPALAGRLSQNTADRAIAAPLVIAQGLEDPVVAPDVTDAWVDERCAAGQRLEYWSFAGADHGTIVQPGTPLEEPLVAWTTARFARAPQPEGCARKAF